MGKNQEEMKQIYEEASMRQKKDPWYARLEALRQDIRRRLGW
jgi:hypothetical protein